MDNLIVNMIDVGYTGTIDPNWLYSDFRHSVHKLISFNPIYDNDKPLHQHHDHYKMAISDISSSKTQFNIYNKTRQSSLFAANPVEIPSAILQSTILVESRRLDSFNIDDFNFLKVDAQGSDLSVIKSLSTHIQHIFGIQVEVFFKQLYLGAPTLEEIHKHLCSHDFYFFKDVHKLDPRFGDYVYINHNAPQNYQNLIKEVYKYANQKNKKSQEEVRALYSKEKLEKSM